MKIDVPTVCATYYATSPTTYSTTSPTKLSIPNCVYNAKTYAYNVAIDAAKPASNVVLLACATKRAIN